MDKEKFEDILTSNEKREVLYESHPIWIEGYNPKREMARIKNLDTGEIEVVPIGVLENTGRIM